MDPRREALASRLARLESAAWWLVRLATTAAIVGGSAGALLWWVTAGHRIDEWWRGTAGSVLVLGLCLAPALWLLNVRSALLDFIHLPDKLRSGDVVGSWGTVAQLLVPYFWVLTVAALAVVAVLVAMALVASLVAL